MADDPPKRKQNFTEYLKVAATQIEQRRKLWEALSIYIHSNGGWVTSLPSAKSLRFEIPRKSPLPSRLLQLGYNLRQASVGTRLMPGNTPKTIFLPVDVIEVTLGK